MSRAPHPEARTSGVATVQLWRGGSRFERITLPCPEPGPGEALVRVELATVCGSDLHTVNGRREAPCPSVLGHEAVGRIQCVGPGGCTDVRGEPLAEGDPVVWGVTVACGSCDRCRSDLSAKCRTLRKTGHESWNGSWPLSGSFASHVLLPAGASLARVPAGVGPGAAAVSACAGATVMACLEAAGGVTGRRVLIAGAGMLGIIAVLAARSLGAAAVQVKDPSPVRRAMALRCGAEPGFPPVDVAVELSGAPDSVTECLRCLDVGGTLVLAGSVAPAGVVAVDPETVVRRRLTVTGVHNYEPRHLPEALEVLARCPGAPWDELIRPPVPLDRLPDLMTPAADPAVLRRSVAP